VKVRFAGARHSTHSPSATRQTRARPSLQKDKEMTAERIEPPGAAHDGDQAVVAAT
jgi:hypothetical protein